MELRVSACAMYFFLLHCFIFSDQSQVTTVEEAALFIQNIAPK